MFKKFKIALLSTVAATLTFSSLFGVKAFFNPNPPPTVYSYNIPRGSNYITPNYITPNYITPYYNTPNYYYQNPYWNQHRFNRSPDSIYFHPNGNMIWVHPNK